MREVSSRSMALLWSLLLLSWRWVVSDVRAAEADDTARKRMVKQQLAAPARGITNARVLAVIGKVPRHEFVPAERRAGPVTGTSLS